MIRLSNALPFQYWLTGKDSFNTKRVCGITQVCFCQPWEAADEAMQQFTDEPFTPETVISEDTVTITIPEPSEWTSRNIDPELVNWSLSPTVNVNLGAVGTWDEQSEQLYVDYDFIPGRVYNITIHLERVEVQPDGLLTAEASLAITDGAFNVQFSESVDPLGTTGDYDISIEFTATSECTRIVLQLHDTGQAGMSGNSSSQTTFDGSDAEETTFTEETTIPDPEDYSLNIMDEDDNILESIPFESVLLEDLNQYMYFIPLVFEDYNITDKQVHLEIIDAGSPGDSPDEVLAYTDCISVKPAHACTILINISNNTDFAGLIYSDQSPRPSFNIRIPATFFHEVNPAEQEDIELSSEDIVRLYNKLEKKQKLDIGFLPYYMHTKVQLALMHDNVLIDEVYWLRRDEYQIAEGNRHYPLKRASVLLTDKNFIKENQL